MVITTADGFTSAAQTQANGANVPVELWNREQLIAEIMAHLHGVEEGYDLINQQQEWEEMENIPLEYTVYDNNGCPSSGLKHRAELQKIRNIVTELQEKAEEEPVADLKDVIANAEAEGIEDPHELIKKLRREGELFELREGILRVI